VKSEKQTQTKPILSAVGGLQMNINFYDTKDYKNFIPLAGYKNKPNSNPISSKAKMNLKSLAKKSGQTRKNGKNLDSGLSLIFLLTIFNMPCKRQRFGLPHLYLRLPVREGPRFAGTQSTGAGKAGGPITHLWIMR